MIQTFTEVFNVLWTALNTSYPSVCLTTDYTKAPASFPAVVIEEKDNYVLTRTIDSGNNENHAVVMYEIGVFSNKEDSKRTEAWNIMAFIDTTLSSYGWVRNSCVPVPNYEDNTIYRLVARYKGTVDKNTNIWRN